jgi:hypothetical protein
MALADGIGRWHWQMADGHVQKADGQPHGQMGDGQWHEHGQRIGARAKGMARYA